MEATRLQFDVLVDVLIDASFKNRIVGCSYAYETSLSEYLLRIKKVVDSFAVVGSPISVDDHIEVIVDGLSEDYAILVNPNHYCKSKSNTCKYI